MTRRACTRCGARLSIYNPGLYCATCETRMITHAEYVEACDPAIDRLRLHGTNTCLRGHDLVTHGVMKNTGGGRMSRKCRECERLRVAAHRLRKATA
jgi:hypothetical protein